MPSLAQSGRISQTFSKLRHVGQNKDNNFSMTSAVRLHSGRPITERVVFSWLYNADIRLTDIRLTQNGISFKIVHIVFLFHHLEIVFEKINGSNVGWNVVPTCALLLFLFCFAFFILGFLESRAQLFESRLALIQDKKLTEDFISLV